MAKFTVVETSEVIRTYVVEAENATEAYETVMSGQVDPDRCEDNHCQAFVYNDNGEEVCPH